VKSGTLGSITYFLFLPIAQNLPIPIPILRKLPILFQNFQFSSNENWKLIGKKLEGDWRKKVYCVPPPQLENLLIKEATKKVATHNTTPLPLSENCLLKLYHWRIHF